MIRIFLAAVLACVVSLGTATASDLSALARLDDAASSVHVENGATSVDLALSQPVPWRLSLADEPARLLLDFRTVTFPVAGHGTGQLGNGVAIGVSEDGWSRMVIALPGPSEVVTAALTRRPDGSARLAVSLSPTDRETFAEIAVQPVSPAPAEPAAPRRRPVVVIDPGHGGIDPGAEAEGMNEKTLMLSVARELEEALLRGGLFDVVLTRRKDEFVPLETRISRARAAGADVFLSLHADELPEGAGDASGITVYTLDEDATDEASRQLAERHGKNDLVSGVSLSAAGDEIAFVLMDLARQDTAPRSAALAEVLKGAFRAENLALVGRPHRAAAFAVLKAPDFPSVLIELGFLSSERDRARLADREWRAAAVRAIEAALVEWSLDDGARAGLRRR